MRLIPTVERLPQLDRNLVRAARRLYVNRELQTRVESRIEWAEAALTAGMGVYGRTAMRVGAFEVEQTDSGVVVRKVAGIDAEQLELPEAGHGVSPHDALQAVISIAAGDGRLEDPGLVAPIDGLRPAVNGGGLI